MVEVLSVVELVSIVEDELELQSRICYECSRDVMLKQEQVPGGAQIPPAGAIS